VPQRRQGLLLEDFLDLLLQAVADRGLLPADSKDEAGGAGSPRAAGPRAELEDAGAGASPAATEGVSSSDAEEEGAEPEGALPARAALGASSSAGGDGGGNSGGSGPSSSSSSATGGGVGRSPAQLERPPRPQQEEGEGQPLAGGDSEPWLGGPGGTGRHVPLEVVEQFLEACFDGMGGVVLSILDAAEVAAAVDGVAGLLAPPPGGP
jgi:hypothetical protein